MTLTELFTNIANSLRAKTGKEEKILAKNFPNEIDSIQSMADTNDATATAEDILEGKTAYVKEEKIVGTMKTSENNAKVNTEVNGYAYSSSQQNYYFANYLTEINEDIICGNYANSLFSNLQNITKIKSVDISNSTASAYMFFYCKNLKNINIVGTVNNLTVSNNMFQNCNSLTEIIGKIDASKLINITNMFKSTSKLTTFNGLKNLGKAYTQTTSNYSSYKLDLSSCTDLTHDSLMNIINNLYDLNITYDVANGGTLYAQALTLGSTNLAKLTEEEIGIAVSKGWNVT